MRVGVIGIGSMGKNHLRVYSEMNQEIVGISDINIEKGNFLAKKYNTKFFRDYRELLKKDLDAVSIAVPTTLHKKVALDCMEKGINILIEKPIADTLRNALEIKAKAEKEDLKVMVGHIERFNPAIEKIKEMTGAGEMGELVSISAKRVGPYNPRIRDVGIIIDLGVHDIDIISYLYKDKVEYVYASAGSVIHNFEDHASILLKFRNGHAGLIETNWLTPFKIRTLTMVGDRGIASIDYLVPSLKLYNEKEEKYIRIEKKEPLKSELEHFIECIKKNKEPIVSIEDGKNALKIALSAIESYKKNKIIKIK
ncbi:gfo/Idh/MocA family oxidoreductase [Thermococci archaeon]|nr:MAG: gfo/Idh/MocA family oxidoreductase [Thermococci archaeon]